MTKQLDLWQSEFGWDYAQRNNNQIEEYDQRLLLRDWSRILRSADLLSIDSVLEVGCSIGRNLTALSNLVSGPVQGVEPNEKAVKTAQERLSDRGIIVRRGTAFDLQFGDASVDMVFTAGVLIHIHPEDLKKATDEIVRVAKNYVVCIEYFSHEPVEISYRGMNGFLFKRDFGRWYVENYPQLKVMDYGFLWKLFNSCDNCVWQLFEVQK
jgi:pseudaminic acid biosynthesis-associated methylase